MSAPSAFPPVAPEKKRSLPIALRLLLVLGGLLFLVVLILVAFFLVKLGGHPGSYRAYTAGSNGMCPTICQREKFLVEIDAYDHRPVERGSIITFDHEVNGKPVLLVKRVVGVAGDKVVVDDRGEVKVNGVAVPVPAGCGYPVMQKTGLIEFGSPHELVVPAGELFVIGDNWSNSNDSRYESYGPVKVTDVTGMPTLIYYSPGAGRFGCVPK
jgi:signal peptidase I